MWIAAIAMAAVGCSSVSHDAGYETVDTSIRDRLQTTAPPVSAAHNTSITVSGPISVDRAVQIAMSNNRALLAAFEEVGLARGDLVEAGLLPNPNFAGRVRWTESSSSTNPELALTWDVMEVIRRSKRRNASRADLDRAAFEASDRAMEFAARVRTAYYDLQASEQVRRMRVEVHRAAKATVELAQRRRAAGNINELENAVEQSVYQDARVDLLRSETTVKLARTSLAGLMGVAAADTSWSVTDELPQIPAADPSIDSLEAVAMTGRFDLLAARKQVEASQHDVSYHKSYWMPTLEVGVDAERDFDGEWAYGPVLEMALPLFDRGQGNVDRANAQLRQAEYAAAAVETSVRNDVRTAWERLQAFRSVVEIYRDDVIPTREKVVAESQRHYNFMLVGPVALLHAKRDEIDAYQKYIEAVRDYWTARAELERAVAIRIEEAP